MHKKAWKFMKLSCMLKEIEEKSFTVFDFSIFYDELKRKLEQLYS